MSNRNFTEFLREDPSMNPESVARREKIKLGIIGVASAITLSLILTGHEKAAKWTGVYTGLQIASTIGEKLLSNAANPPTSEQNTTR